MPLIFAAATRCIAFECQGLVVLCEIIKVSVLYMLQLLAQQRVSSVDDSGQRCMPSGASAVSCVCPLMEVRAIVIATCWTAEMQLYVAVSPWVGLT